MLTHEQFLAASYFGKYFARNINLYLLQRRPDEWRELQSQRKSNSAEKMTGIHPAASVTVQKQNSEVAEVSPPSKTSKKRRSRPEDEIDAVFNTNLGAKVKRTAVNVTGSYEKSIGQKSVDQGLQDVLGAIRAAPSDDSGRGKRQKR